MNTAYSEAVTLAKIMVKQLDSASPGDAMARLCSALVLADAELVRLREGMAGAEGELMGLRMSEAFHRRRCDMLEAAAVRRLTESESDTFKGCCPLCGRSQAP
jgi:hypothetical protein